MEGATKQRWRNNSTNSMATDACYPKCYAGF